MQIEWSTLGQPELVAELQAGLAERDRRIQELMGIAPAVPAAAPRGPGRPPKQAHDLSTRAGQLAAAESEAS